MQHCVAVAPSDGETDGNPHRGDGVEVGTNDAAEMTRAARRARRSRFGGRAGRGIRPPIL